MTSANVTKSVRLRTEESEELARLSQLTLVSESALMKQWIQEGIQAKKLELAIQAYMDRKTDLRGGAIMAGVSYNRFMPDIQCAISSFWKATIYLIGLFGRNLR